MAERRAGVRLDLTNSGFNSKMADARRAAQDFTRTVDDIGGAAERTGRKTSGFLGALKAGAGGAKSALAELGGTIKNTLTMAATLGGTLSIGAAANEAKTLSSLFGGFGVLSGEPREISASSPVSRTRRRHGRESRELRPFYCLLGKDLDEWIHGHIVS
jgi:hypothetical protein